MNRFYGHRFFRLSRNLTSAATVIERQPAAQANATFNDSTAEIVKGVLEKALKESQDIGLDVSAILIGKMIKAVDERCKYSEFKDMSNSLLGRIEDEMSLVLLMQVPKGKADFYSQANLFGQQVTDNFPSATLDIEEAGKCYATGRNTATVMHLMRVMEVGLRVTARGLNLPNPTNANWQTIIDKINKEINQKTAAKDPAWLKIEPFYAQVSAQLFAVKTAWRNPVMHVHSTYDEERALDIFNAVKGFMRHLATQLKE